MFRGWADQICLELYGLGAGLGRSAQQELGCGSGASLGKVRAALGSSQGEQGQGCRVQFRSGHGPGAGGQGTRSAKGWALLGTAAARIGSSGVD